jgi:dephospho-CoA kinase
MLLRGVVCLHASAVAIGDEAIALLGPAGSGKSTTAAAFAERGYSVLAEDVVTLDDRGDHFWCGRVIRVFVCGRRRSKRFMDRRRTCRSSRQTGTSATSI